MKNANDWKEYLPLMFEFIISLVSIMGFLVASIYDPNNETIKTLAPVVITAVITFWFQRRQTEQLIKKQQENTIEQTRAVAAPIVEAVKESNKTEKTE